MTDKTHANLRKVENYAGNKAYPGEILCDKDKKSNFRKACKNFSVVNGHLMYMHKEKRSVLLEKERQQLITNGAHEGLGDHPEARA